MGDMAPFVWAGRWRRRERERAHPGLGARISGPRGIVQPRPRSGVPQLPDQPAIVQPLVAEVELLPPAMGAEGTPDSPASVSVGGVLDELVHLCRGEDVAEVVCDPEQDGAR